MDHKNNSQVQDTHVLSKRRGITREKVIVEALYIIDQEGLEKLTLGNLARRLNVQVPSLYNHVSNIAEVMELLTIRGLIDLIGMIKLAAVGKSHYEAIVSLSHEYRKFAQKNKGLYQLVFGNFGNEADQIKLLRTELVDILRLVLNSYGLSENGEVQAIRVWRSVLHGFVDIELHGGFGMSYDIEQSFELVIQNFIRGITVFSSI